MLRELYDWMGLLPNELNRVFPMLPKFLSELYNVGYDLGWMKSSLPG
jgi:hypothetical protein